MKSISRDALDRVDTVITHTYPSTPCPDGVASAIILRDVLTNVGVVFLAHGTKAYEELPARPGLLFCDLTPPANRVQEFVDAGSIVLDHHDKQKEIVERFGDRGVYSSEPGVSGAMLAFLEVWAWSSTEGSESWKNAHEFAMLAGIRDTWQTKSALWKLAREQAEALRFYPWFYFSDLGDDGDVFRTSGWSDIQELLSIGKTLVKRADARTKQLVSQAYGVKTEERKTRVMIIGSLETSDVAEADGDGADLVVGFSYRMEDGKGVLQLSMRSHTGYDEGALCKSLGGGGHKPAAGATLPVTSGDLNPYEVITKIITDYERGSNG